MIKTLDALIEIAPSEDARSDLEDAQETLREVQEETDTSSLGSDERDEDE